MKTSHSVGLSLAYLILSSAQDCLAFSLIPPEPSATFRYQEESIYFAGGSEWTTEILDDVWFRPLPRGGTFRFSFTLNFLWTPRATPPFLRRGWIFRRADRDLEGSFEIATYSACAFREPCGGETGVGPSYENETSGVGAVFGLKYHPSGSDPTPENSDLHWIQVVSSNRRFLPFVDNSPRFRFDNPYYDTDTRFAGEDFFTDRPYFFAPNSPTTPNFFIADLYLVEEITRPGSRIRQVVVHNGIRWGWRNIETDPGCEGGGSSGGGGCQPPPCIGGTGGGSCDGGSGSSGGGGTTSSFRDREVPLFENDDEAAEDPEKIPEATSLLGLFALSSWGIFQWLKNRKHK